MAALYANDPEGHEREVGRPPGLRRPRPRQQALRELLRDPGYLDADGNQASKSGKPALPAIPERGQVQALVIHQPGEERRPVTRHATVAIKDGSRRPWRSTGTSQPVNAAHFAPIGCGPLAKPRTASATSRPTVAGCAPAVQRLAVESVVAVRGDSWKRRPARRWTDATNSPRSGLFDPDDARSATGSRSPR